MQHWNARKKERGFTLTEVLVVSIIFSILAAISVPNLIGLLNKARVSDGLTSLEGAIKEAQRQAIRFSQSCTIEMTTEDIDGEPRAVIRPDPAVGGNNDRCLLERRVLPKKVSLAIVPAIDTIAISSKGNFNYTSPSFPSATNRTITVSHSGIPTEKCLRIDGLFGDVQKGFVEAGACTID